MEPLKSRRTLLLRIIALKNILQIQKLTTCALRCFMSINEVYLRSLKKTTGQYQDVNKGCSAVIEKNNPFINFN